MFSTHAAGDGGAPIIRAMCRRFWRAGSLEWRVSQLGGPRSRLTCAECLERARFPDGRCGSHTGWLPERQRVFYEFEYVWRSAKEWLLGVRTRLEWLAWSEFRDRARALALEWDAEAAPRVRESFDARLVAARVGPHGHNEHVRNGVTNAVDVACAT